MLRYIDYNGNGIIGTAAVDPVAVLTLATDEGVHVRSVGRNQNASWYIPVLFGCIYCCRVVYMFTNEKRPPTPPHRTLLYTG